MIGPRVGPIVGPTVGARIGIGVDELSAASGMAGVTKDATSGIYCPKNLTEWNQTLSVAGISSGGPSALQLCQEASGNLADSIGSFTLTFNAGSGSSYRNAVSGWSRLAINTSDAGTAAWNTTSASLPDISTGSLLALAYGKLNGTPAAVRALITGGTTTAIEGRMTTTPAYRILDGANTQTGASNPSGGVRPYVIKHNVTASAAAGYTDQDKVVPAFAACTGKKINIGNGGALGASFSYLYVAWFFNAAAELTDAQVKKLLQTLGWTIAWS